MDTNTLLGLAFAFVGMMDIILARVLGDRLKLPPVVRTILTAAGVAFFLFGALLALRVIRLL